MKTRKLLFALLIPACLWLLQSCYPGGAETINELDLVATSYDQNYDFAKVRTYVLPDSVVHIKDQYGRDLINPAFDEYVLREIANQMEVRGFVRLDSANSANQKADVVVLAAVSSSTNVNVSSAGGLWDSWGWYSGWGSYGVGPGYGYGYPGYYNPVVVTSYKEGSMIIQMVDPNQASPGNKTVPTVWVASFSGLLEGSQSSILDRIRGSIQRAFTQSPYLTK